MDEISNVDSVQNNRKRRKVSYVSQKRKRLNQSTITTEDVNNQREAEIMFHSNLFKMQVDELLKELKEKVSQNDISRWCQDFKDFLMNIPESSICLIKDFSLDNVEIPILQIPESNKGTFKFIPPVKIIEIGSWVLDTMCSSSPVIDIAVEIPKVSFQAIDYLNHRYHRKRAFYLAYIASCLLETDLIDNMQFSYQNNCHLKPILLITPKGIENVTVSLTAYPNMRTFKPSRFIPSKNNVRSSWYFGEEEDSLQATPYYNSSVMSDLILPTLNDYLKEIISSQSVKDGIILLKLWCLQRGLTTGYGRINGFILTMFVAYLIKKKKVTPLMSAYQVFRCALINFGDQNICSQGIKLCDEVSSITEFETFQNLFDVVFIDETGVLNVCYNVNKETLYRVQHEAKLGLKILEKEASDSFSDLFLKKITLCQKFEYILHFKKPKQFKKYLKKLDMVNKTLDFGEDNVACAIPKICDILKRGLNERVSLMDVMKSPHLPWSVSEAPPDPNAGRVTIGFLLNPNVTLSNLEKGPLADDPKAKEFRKFWGEKSEMRRFQDGTIHEAVFWSAATSADKRKVFSTIITDILARHIDAEENHIQVYGTEVDSTLRIPESVLSTEFSPYGTGEESHLKLMQSFHTLCKEVRGLSGLPLLIASIQGSSPSFRFSEVFPPLSVMHEANSKYSYVDGHIIKLKDTGVGVPPYIQALKVVVTLEGSGKWPDDIEAIKRVKAAFHLKIAELIKSQCSLITVPSEKHVDIFKDGFVFRVEVSCHKEIFLLKQVKTIDGSVKIQENQESRSLEISTVIMPKLNSILHGLCQQHNTFGTACRLAKRWISSQLKYGFINDVAIELLVAYIYIHPEPYTCPSSPQVAFIRFLSLLINHDWLSSPIVVNLNNELSMQEIEEIYSSFTSQRSTLPQMVIATPFDKRGSMWTRNMPSALILKRILILADASLKILENILNSTKISDVKAIFRPPLESFDVLIYLKRKEIPTLSCAVDAYRSDNLPEHIPYKQELNELYPVVEYNPIKKYLEELRENFGDFAVFLYDIYGGDFISVVWKRSAFIAKEFKASNVYCRTLYGDGSQVIPDVERILEDFHILGSGLVRQIVKQTENWQIP